MVKLVVDLTKQMYYLDTNKKVTVVSACLNCLNSDFTAAHLKILKSASYKRLLNSAMNLTEECDTFFTTIIHVNLRTSNNII